MAKRETKAQFPEPVKQQYINPDGEVVSLSRGEYHEKYIHQGYTEVGGQRSEIAPPVPASFHGREPGEAADDAADSSAS